MDGKHIVRSFDRDLDDLKAQIIEMGNASKSQLSMTIQALINKNRALARQIVAGDQAVNAMQREVDRLTVDLLARRQPLALDLRMVVASLKIAADLERVADYSANIARHVFTLDHLATDEPIASIHRMMTIAEDMLTQVLTAFDTLDREQAKAAWTRDDDIDHIYKKILTQLRTFMSKAPDSINASTSLLFVARCCERIGDHITNIAESIHYIVEGTPFTDHAALS